MLNPKEIHNIRELVHAAAKTYGGKDYMRYMKNGEINSISFYDFKEATDSISAWTMEQNKKFGRPVKVAMLSPNSALYAKILFGVMCGGGISVPMDAQITQEALCNCLNRAEVDIVLYDKTIKLDRENIYNKCKTITSIFYMKDEESFDCVDITEQYKGIVCEPEINEKDCAIIIFTSGTTGVEKGVMLSHANLIDTTFNADFDPAVQLSILPMHHAFGLKADFLVALNIASTTCFFDGMDKLGEALHMYQPSGSNMVPMIANALYSKIVILSRQTDKSLEECKELVYGKNMKQIITGGAHLPSELVEKYQAIGIYIAQGYGMSECSPSITVPNMYRPDKAYSSGQLVRGCEYRIVDGELQVKSPSVMIGYVNAPDLTKEILTEDGWLCTGDLGYVDEERFLFITGRKKNLIILSNGENVAPEQIENRLLDHQLVEECLVYGEGNQVVAEIYPNDKYAKLHNIKNVLGEVDKIIDDVNSKLESYKKIMKHYVRKNPFLKTSTNKVIRNQRVKTEDILSNESDKVTMPFNEMQKTMHQIFSEIMGHEDFGIDTDLFSVGLDSLGCIMTLTELSVRLDFNIELDELMSNSTIEKLEALYKKKSDAPKIDYSIRTIYPLTNAQKYTAYVLRGNTTANIPFLYQLDYSVDLVRLKNAIKKLFEIHPILKGSISMYQDKGLVMYRDDKKEIDIPIYNMTKEEWLETKNTLIKPYMYGKDDPLYHIGLYNIENEKYFFIDIAHAISDGMTLSILLRNLEKLYQGETVEKESYTFYEFMVDDQFRAENGLRKRDELYFKKLLDGVRLDRTILNKVGNGDLNTEENAVIHDIFYGLNHDELNKFCNKNGVSKNILFLTAFNHCISIFSDEDDTISTSVHNGRTDSRWASIAGAVYIVYNFRYQSNRNKTINEMLETSAKQVMETMCCHINNLHADEMFFQYQGDLFSDMKLGGEMAVHIPLQLDSMPFHLMVYENKDKFTYELRYWKNRFEEKQLRVFMEVLEAVVNGMTKSDYVSDIKSYIPKEYLVSEKMVHTADGKDVIVTIKDRYGDVQPLGGWGRLFIDDVDTEKIARLTPDGIIDYIEDSGRTVMQESITGRHFVDLNKVEQDVKAIAEIDCEVQAYIKYGENNKLMLVADILTNKEINNKEDIRETVAAHCKKSHQPTECIFKKVSIENSEC